MVVMCCVVWKILGIVSMVVSDVFFMSEMNEFDSVGSVMCVVCGRIVWCSVCVCVIDIEYVVFYCFFGIDLIML